MEFLLNVTFSESSDHAIVESGADNCSFKMCYFDDFGYVISENKFRALCI